MNEWIQGRLDRWMSGYREFGTIGQMDEWIQGVWDDWTDGWVDKDDWTDG